MIENQKIRPAKVIGPLGEPLTLETLPPADTTRWVVRRKAEVVAAVNGGLLTVDEVCDRYGLTAEEFASWQRAIDRSGMPGLRVTRIQHYKSLYERQQKYCASSHRGGSGRVPSLLRFAGSSSHDRSEARRVGKECVRPC